MPLGQQGKRRTDRDGHPLDEEALAHTFPGLDRKAHGAFFTPAPLVELVLDLVDRHLPRHGPVALVDPSCGAGAFLSAAGRRHPDAALFGLELHEDAGRFCAARVPKAQIVSGDALRGGWDRLLERLPPDAFEAWVGNPPYNGTSALLKDPEAYRPLRALLPEALPRGTSLRDDYAFFLLRAADRVARRGGLVAFVTSATLLDGFLYAPLRRALLGRLHLAEVVELGAGAFEGARVRTCVTAWTAPSKGQPARYQRRAVSGTFRPEQLEPPVSLSPAAPDFVLRPPDEAAARLEAAWRADGEPLTTLIPVSSPGLKTRFDELLVDDDPGRLLERVRAFCQAGPGADELAGFARAFGLPDKLLPKLVALREWMGGPVEVDPSRVRPFFRYAGARHRGAIPDSARAFCYLDRRLIPRGDHRLRGSWDPHASAVKLVFNVRELPLSAALLEQEGCVHDHRHARFAPLYVPERILREGPDVARKASALGPLLPNLSARGLQWAQRLGGPLALYAALARFINSDPVQQSWAPAFGALRELPVCQQALERHAAR